jgi:hypothetical protein
MKGIFSSHASSTHAFGGSKLIELAAQVAHWKTSPQLAYSEVDEEGSEVRGMWLGGRI